MKTPEQQKEYHHEYYILHKDHYYQQFRDWCKANPKRITKIRHRWLAKNPHYQRDYQRKRKAITDPLVFHFLDYGGSGSDIDGYVIYLRNRGIPEQHVNWFLKDVQKHLEGA